MTDSITLGAFTLEGEQLIAYNELCTFLEDTTQREISLKGRAGTGKTTLLGLLPLPENTHIIALSNKACGVLYETFSKVRSSLSQEEIASLKKQAGGSLYAYDKGISTIAAYYGLEKTYDKVTGEMIFLPNARGTNNHDRAKILIVDEGSMYGHEYRLYSLVHEHPNTKIIYLVDKYQNPPINSVLLRVNILKVITDVDFFGDSFSFEYASWMEQYAQYIQKLPKEGTILSPTIDLIGPELTDNKRAGKTNPSIKLFNRLTELIDFSKEVKSWNFFKEVGYDIYEFNETTKCGIIKGSIETMVDYARQEGIEDTVVITHSNKARNSAITRVLQKVIPNYKFGVEYYKDVPVIFNEDYYEDNKKLIGNSTIAVIKEVNVVRINYTILHFEGAGVFYKITFDNGLKFYKTCGEDSAKELAEVLKVAEQYARAAGVDHIWSQYHTDRMAVNLDFSVAYGMTSYKAQGSGYKIVSVNVKDFLNMVPVEPVNRLRSLYTAVTRTTAIIVLE